MFSCTEVKIMMKKNIQGRYYRPGLETDVLVKSRVIDLFHEGKNNYSEIGKNCGLSRSTVRKIVEKSTNGDSMEPTIYKPGPVRRKSSDDVVDAVRFYTYRQPSIYRKEIQERLVSDGIVTLENMPSVTTISNIMKRDLRLTRKKLTLKPQEALSEQAQAKFDTYVDLIMTKNPYSLHFFDECSVVKTTGNRRYGHALIGEPAVEIQRYASNATFTVNLLHGPFGVESFNIIDGPSNGFHLVDFFSDAVSDRNVHGNLFLQQGDTVIMDNCGFHHGRIAEGNLRNLLTQQGVELVFQPPYHPDLNSCEMCFKIMKDFLRRHSSYSEKYTELAICDGLNEVTPSKSMSIFRGCGYI